MKHKLIYIVILTVPYQVAAAEETFQSNWYAGVGWGQGHYTNGGQPLLDDRARDRFSGNLYLGVQVNPFLAPELSFQYLGNGYSNYDQGQISGDLQQLVVAARFGYPVTSSLYPYAKMGVAGWFGDNRSHSGRGVSPMASAGIEYAFTSRLSGRLEYQYTSSLGSDTFGHTDHHLTTLGLNWRFGYSDPEIRPEPEIITKIVELPPVVQVVEKRLFIYSEQGSSVLFAHNSSVLDNKSQFADAVDFLKQHPSASAVVTGYTDDTGSDKYNQWMSERRAASVVNYFISKGVDSSRLKSLGKGALNPIADNGTEDGRAMNRRVEIIIPTFTINQTVK